MSLHFSTGFRRHKIKTVETLAQIQTLSNERQQLWRIAHRDKFSDGWWTRHDRIQYIGRQLERLWAVHRSEVAADQVWEVLATDRIHSSLFDDFHERNRLAGESEWRIEDETAHQPHWMTAEHGFLENRVANDLKKPTKRRAIAPKERPKPVKNLQLA